MAQLGLGAANDLGLVSGLNQLGLSALLATPQIPPPPPIKRKIFVSYHHAGDQAYYDAFAKFFADKYEVFFDKSLERAYESNNDEYVRFQIRNNDITGSSCTIVLCGALTHQRKYVDWEIKATLDKMRPATRKDIVRPDDKVEATLPDEGNYPGVDLDEIETLVEGVLHRFLRGLDPELRAVVVDQPDLRGADVVVDPCLRSGPRGRFDRAPRPQRAITKLDSILSVKRQSRCTQRPKILVLQDSVEPRRAQAREVRNVGAPACRPTG